VPVGTIKRRGMQMRQNLVGILAQMRDEYMSGGRVADADVIQETMQMVMRIAAMREGQARNKGS